MIEATLAAPQGARHVVRSVALAGALRGLRTVADDQARRAFVHHDLDAVGALGALAQALHDGRGHLLAQEGREAGCPRLEFVAVLCYGRNRASRRVPRFPAG